MIRKLKLYVATFGVSVTVAALYLDAQTGNTPALTVTSAAIAQKVSSTSAAQKVSSTSLTANRPVHWTLAPGSVGSLVVTDSTHATFMPPASIPATHNLFGCQIMPLDSVFYSRIDELPVHPESATWIANSGPNINMSFDTSMQLGTGDATIAPTSERFAYTPTHDGMFLVPPFFQVARQGGALQGNQGADHHMITIQHDTCQTYEIYNFGIDPQTGLSLPYSCGANTMCTAQSGLTYSAQSAPFASGSTDAAGLPIAPLVWTAREIMDGNINHPLRFSLVRGYIQSGHPLWPATGGNGWGGSNSPPYGAWARVKASFVPGGTSKLSPIQLKYFNTMLTALKEHGVMLADIGGTWNTGVAADAQQNPDILAALNLLQQITAGSALEFVDASSLKADTVSYRSTQPVVFADVIATDASNPANQITTSVPLLGVTVGVPDTYLNILAGVKGYQLEAWVNGTADQTVSWSVQSGDIGSVTLSGYYTPAASVSSITQGVLVATSQADPNATATVYVRVIPNLMMMTSLGTESTRANNAIRIDMGSSSPTIDSFGTHWLPDFLVGGGDTVRLSYDGGAWTLGTAIQQGERNIYQSTAYTYGNDFTLKVIVPNQNYVIRAMMGQPFNGKPANCVLNDRARSPIMLEAQNQIEARDIDYAVVTGGKCGVGFDVSIPAQVTNNVLEFAMRPASPNNPTCAGGCVQAGSLLSGIDIEQDPYPARITIDTQQRNQVALGGSLQLYAVGWYMSNSVIWTVSGAGSINAEGVYTAPASLPRGVTSTTATIKATSTANPSITASATLTIP